MKIGCIVSLAMLAFCLCPPGPCDTHYVSPEGSDEAPYLSPETAARSIQSAVDVASPGDTVSVGPGNYRGTIVMGPGLKLVGSGADQTRIWGGITAGIDSEIRAVAVTQDWGGDDPDYQPVAITGPRMGSMVIADCRISGTFEEGIQCRSEGGFTAILDCEIRAEAPRDSMLGISIWSWAGQLCLIDRCRLQGAGVQMGSHANELWVTRTTFSGLGSGLSVQSGEARLVACAFDRCSTALGIEGNTRVIVESTALTRSEESGLWCGDDAQVELHNCTITRNAYGISLNYSEIEACSCIIWGNAEDVRVQVPEPYCRLEVTYSDVGNVPPGTLCWENIDTDPLFRDSQAGDFRLRPDSPCIDAGLEGASHLYKAHDLDGMGRVAYGGKEDHHRVDMGAYEYYINRLCAGPVPGQLTLTWSSWQRRTYSIFYSEDLLTWRLAEEAFAAGPGPLVLTTSWTDDGSLTGLAPSLAPRRFYRLLENP